MTCVLLIFKAGVNFLTAPPNSQLRTKPASEVNAQASQRQREYTLYEYLNTSALHLAGAIRETQGDALEG